VQLRRVGATAREALLDLAAEAFQTDRKNLSVSGGKVSKVDTNDSMTFAQVTKGQQLLKSVTEQSRRLLRRIGRSRVHRCRKWMVASL
jgi:hypothetical protein